MPDSLFCFCLPGQIGSAVFPVDFVQRSAPDVTSSSKPPAHLMPLGFLPLRDRHWSSPALACGPVPVLRLVDPGPSQRAEQAAVLVGEAQASRLLERQPLEQTLPRVVVGHAGADLGRDHRIGLAARRHQGQRSAGRLALRAAMAHGELAILVPEPAGEVVACVTWLAGCGGARRQTQRDRRGRNECCESRERSAFHGRFSWAGDEPRSERASADPATRAGDRSAAPNAVTRRDDRRRRRVHAPALAMLSPRARRCQRIAALA